MADDNHDQEDEMHHQRPTQTEPETADREVLDRTSGEVLPLTGAATDRLARFLDDTKELESILAETKALVSGELLRRMDQEASWTLRAGDYELRGQSPEAGATYYEPVELEEALRRLRRQGQITKEAAKAALSYEVAIERKPRQAGIRALLRRGGEVAEELLACRHRVEQAPRRRVSVRRAHDEQARRAA